MTEPLRVHRPDVQGLRAIAVILVILYHTDLPVPGGFIGVDVFFVISGFVITRLLWRELQERNRINLRRFYARRARRLLPALAVVLGFVAVGSVVIENPLGSQQLTAQTVLAAALFVANAALFLLSGGYFDAPTEANPLLHTWTLAVEEQFYLFFPLVLLLAWRVRRSKNTKSKRAAVAASVATVLLLSFVACLFLTSADGLPFGEVGNNRFAFYASPTRAWEFAAGSLLAICEVPIARLRPAVGHFAGSAGLLLVLVAAFVLDSTTVFPGVAALLPVAGASLVILAGTVTSARVTTILAATVLKWIGDRSYGWYLWHWPCIVFAKVLWPEGSTLWLVAAALVALIPTALSFNYIENPIRRNRAIRGRRVIRLAVVCTLIPAGLSSALYGSTLWPLDPLRELQTQVRPHLDVTQGCLSNLPEAPTTRTACTWGPPLGPESVLLLGDSNAGHFAEPVLQAARERGLGLTMATFGGCAFADVRTRYDVPYDEAGCANFIQQWTEEVMRTRPAVVILSNSSSEYVNSGNGVTFDDPTGSHPTASSTDAKAAAWEAGIARTIRSWSDVGIPSVVVHAVPHYDAFDLRQCPSFRVLLDVSSCGRQLSRAEAERQLWVAKQAEATAVRLVPDARALELIDDLCTADTCATNRGTAWLYRDGAHLSVPFSLTLTNRFGKAIDSARAGPDA